MPRGKGQYRFGRGVAIPEDVARDVLKAALTGEPRAVTAGRFGVSESSVLRLLRNSGGMRSRRTGRSKLQLTLAERSRIEAGLAQGETFRAIGLTLGRSTSTISREVNSNGGRDDYHAGTADEAADAAALRPRPTVFELRLGLAAYVNDKLAARWSPEEISNRLRTEFPDDEEMWVSHETIYQSLFVQSRGGLNKALVKQLRSGRVRRRPHRRSTIAKSGQIVGMTMISERPAEADDRAVPGYWEGDLIIGANQASQIGTLVERTFRLCLLLHLPNGRSTEEVVAAMQRQIATLPDQLFKAITWDQGKELASHAKFSVATGIPVYFCEPHSPWQRGTNENTNGLLRQYFPKGTDLSVYSQADLDAVAAELNGRPRRVLGYLTPSEAYARFVALTA